MLTNGPETTADGRTPRSEPAAIVQVRDLRKRYGNVEAVRGVSFDVYAGEVFGLLGPNGAGKTTTIEMIEGLTPIDRGSVTVQGIDVTRDPYGVRRIVGVQLQKASFFEQLTLAELLELFGNLYGRKVDPKPLLARVDLLDLADRTIKKLSGGQQQRFGIAIALVNEPTVLFLDEPTTGLDARARRNLWEMIRSLRHDGRAIVLTTHYIEEAEVLCDRVAIMDEGRIVALDRPAALIEQLIGRGFSKPAIVPLASLEDVFLDLTGRHLAGPKGDA